MRTQKYRNAFLIGNGGLGDMVSCSGIANYLATIYENVLIACMNNNYEQACRMYYKKNIIIYPINREDTNMGMYKFSHMMITYGVYDVYAIGNYGAEIVDPTKYIKYFTDGTERRVISNYPASYYFDAGLPFEYASKYFHVEYPENIEKYYTELFALNTPYIILHTDGSNSIINPHKYDVIDVENNIIIDVNFNFYKKGHKYYNIAQKFINLQSILYYVKLLENANEFYLIDSCIHAMCLVIDISKVKKKVCYQRESRFNYYFKNITYYKLIFPNGYDKQTSNPDDIVAIDLDKVALQCEK